MGHTNIGDKIYISATLPATDDQTGFEAISGFTQIAEAVSIGPIGMTDSLVDAPDLETGLTEGLKGPYSGTPIPFAFKEKLGDAGQELAYAAGISRNEYSFKIVRVNTGRTIYTRGPVYDYQENEASNSTYAGSTFNIRPNIRPVRVTN